MRLPCRVSRKFRSIVLNVRSIVLNMRSIVLNVRSIVLNGTFFPTRSGNTPGISLRSVCDNHTEFEYVFLEVLLVYSIVLEDGTVVIYGLWRIRQNAGNL